MSGFLGHCNFGARRLQAVADHSFPARLVGREACMRQPVGKGFAKDYDAWAWMNERGGTALFSSRIPS